jgi:hypothetical protein
MEGQRMQNTNGDERHAPPEPAPEGNDRPERRRTYPEGAPPADWEDDHIDLGGEGG